MKPAFSEPEELLIRPAAGIVDAVALDQIPDNAAREMENFHHDRQSLDRRPGRALHQTAADDPARCLYQYKNRTGTIKRLLVAGEKLYVVAANPATAPVGAVSGATPATVADIIGSDAAIGGFVQVADRAYYADGGALRLYFDGTNIRPWGFQGGALSAGTVGDEASGGDLVPGKEYSYRWSLYNPTTGNETNLSAESAKFKCGGVASLPQGKVGGTASGTGLELNKAYTYVWTLKNTTTGEETGPSPESEPFTATTANKQKRKITIGPWPEWKPDYDDYNQIRIYRSKADAPGVWYHEKDVTITVDLSTTKQSSSVEAADGALGAGEPPQNKSRSITIGPWAGWVDYTDYTTLKIYRTPGDIDGAWYLEKSITGLTNFDTVPQTTTLSVSDEELTDEGTLTDNEPPPKVKYPVLFGSQVVAVDADDPSAVVFSKGGSLANPQAWPPENKLYAARDDGSPIAGVFAGPLGRLYVVKEGGGVYGTTPDGYGSFMPFELVVPDVDCVSHWSVVKWRTWWFWLSTRGAYRFDGQNAANISSPKIRVLYTTFAENGYIDRAFGVADTFSSDHHYLRWLVTKVESTDPVVLVTHHLIYDLEHDCWFTERPGPTTLNPIVGGNEVVAAIVNDTEVWTADSGGRVFTLRLDWVTASTKGAIYSDAGANYPSTWWSKWFGDGSWLVLPLYVEFELEWSVQGEDVTALTMKFIRDVGGPAVSPETQTFALYDPGTGDDAYQTRALRMNLTAGVCRRFSVGVFLEGKDSDLKILSMRVVFQRLTKRLIGA